MMKILLITGCIAMILIIPVFLEYVNRKSQDN